MADLLYATDEDLAIRASADFALLCPRDQKLAAGLDGSFDPGDRWTLKSASVDFQAAGVTPGAVVQLLAPITAYRPPGEALVVAAVAPFAVTLRRKGQNVASGQPPASATGLIGVEFLIASLAPQIARASGDLDRRFGLVGPSGARAITLLDPREVREAAVLTVLSRQYLAMSREAATGSDALAAKAARMASELDDLLARLVVHGSPGSGGSTRFGARLSR